MNEYNAGDSVVISDFPTLKGKIVSAISPDRDMPGMLVVRIWIPEGEPGFWITGIYESFWCMPEELTASTPEAAQ